MAVKVTSPRAELAVLRGMTNRNKKIAGTLLTSVDESYFDAPESKEIYTSLKKMMATTGEAPSYRLLIEDPDLSVNARKFFRDSEATIQSVEEAQKASKILNRYRQLRSLYSLASRIDQKLQSGRVDVEELLEESSVEIAMARSQKVTRDAFVHIGKNNNAHEMVKDLLYNDEQDDTIPTGIKAFDDHSGGLPRGGLTTIGASSGGGKCSRLETRIQLATLVIELDNELIIEAEPEDLLVVRRADELVRVPASLLCTGDEIEIDPQELMKLDGLGFPLKSELT